MVYNTISDKSQSCLSLIQSYDRLSMKKLDLKNYSKKIKVVLFNEINILE